MSPTIALLGHNGKVGVSVFLNLLKAHREGKIALTVLHREGSDLSKVPTDAGVETRLIDLSETGVEKTKSAVKDADVVISTVGNAGLKAQEYLVQALVGSSKLKTFIHSDFGNNWTQAEYAAAPGLAVGIGLKEHVAAKAKELGVPITNIRIGVLAPFFLGHKVLGTYIKENKFQTFRNNLTNPIRLTNFDYLGYAVAYLVSDESRIAQLPGQTYQIYDVEVTGQQVIDTLTKVHGQAPEITALAEEEFEKTLKTPLGLFAAVYAKWGSNLWGEGEKLAVGEWTPKPFEDQVKQFI
ncbi:hypothetical protein CI109_100285 [Kwoniella shandongensis]|uniref:NmrA-like domain-containing protein n=1 Tax=Kwoniella shandongensis TaxID=1734106 RepID=A0A5M6C591_9TREE|nr:uncharacterized protein CI109_001870 [Kwoniella shandongensis]KAA5529930.1 hypothetical protein CI109_001870 [Kwoniella shandongensis]